MAEFMDKNLRQEILQDVAACDGVAGVKWSAADDLVLELKADVHLPQSCQRDGVSPQGVKAVELVRIRFDEWYPFSAPQIILRDDFPRCFPHIYPSATAVYPCVYEGSLVELVQTVGIGGVILQLMEWLRKAAANDLMDLNQGWEWMRNDVCEGVLYGKFNELREKFTISNGIKLCCAHKYSPPHGERFWAELALDGNHIVQEGARKLPCFLAVAPQTHVASSYFPRRIGDLGELRAFLLDDVGESITTRLFDSLTRKVLGDEKEFIIVTFVRRPVHLINNKSNIEVIPFLVLARWKGKSKLLNTSGVKMLGAIDRCDPLLMRRVSGHNHAFGGRIIQLGCGSVGSKISMHLVRNGQERHVFVDKGGFLAHNMARHALTFDRGSKAMAMACVASSFGVEVSVEVAVEKTIENSSEADLIIDSTASLAVRNRLAMADVKPRVIHTSLYGRNEHQCGVCFIEGDDRNPRVDDLHFTFMRANVFDGLKAIDYTVQNLERSTYGQGCSSLTMKVDDSTISLLAAGMAHHIQKNIDDCFPGEGDCSCALTEDGESVAWDRVPTGKTCILPGCRNDGYSVRILAAAKEEMNRLVIGTGENETGGYLFGAITPSTRTITVVYCTPPPKDSTASPTLFVLGVEGIGAMVREIEEKSNGTLGILGTWHSHPMGGKPSRIDQATYDRLFAKRNFPTLCLIWTPSGFECLPEVCVH